MRILQFLPHLRHYHKAVEYFEKALQLSQELKYNPEKIHILMQLGLLQWNIGQMENSSSHYKQALNLARISSQKEKAQECLSALEIFDLYSIGKDRRSSGKYKESIDFFKKAINLNNS
jgi:tetratricopeptide (TPR) repeat protein